jgi:serine/threonine protein kinase
VLHTPVSDEALRRRFDRECAALRRLASEPNVVTLLDSGIDDGRAYLVTPLYGGTYADRLESLGRVDPAEVARVGADIAAALAAAHAVGIVHRDVKPSNVFIADNGTAVLGDFGTAGLLDAQTITGSVALSIAYAAPEMLELGEVSPASDLYALGVTMYHLVTGTLPFGGSPISLGDAAGVGALVRRIANEPPAEIIVADAPVSLVEMIAALLSKDPRDRPQDARQVATKLEAMTSGPSASSDGPHRSKKLLIVGAAVFAAAIVGVAIGSLRSGSSAEGTGADAVNAELASAAANPDRTNVGTNADLASVGTNADLASAGSTGVPVTTSTSLPASSAATSTTTGSTLPATTTPPPSVPAYTGCESASMPVCSQWDDGLGGWSDTSNPRFGRVEPTQVGASSGASSLGLFPSDATTAGGTWLERPFVLPSGSASLHVRMKLYVQAWGPDTFWTNLLALTDDSGRQWRVNLIAADTADVRVDMWTEDAAGVGFGGSPTETFPTEQWLCIEFDVQPSGEVPATLSIDGRQVALIAPFGSEPLGSEFEARLGSIYINTPAQTPDVLFDDIAISADTRPGC